jgi:hypothetical protein
MNTNLARSNAAIGRRGFLIGSAASDGAGDHSGGGTSFLLRETQRPPYVIPENV